MKNKPSETYTSPFTEVNPYQRNIEPLVMRETLPIPFALKFKYALKISGLSILINLSVQISVCALILCISPASLNLINSYFLTQMGLGLIPCLAIFTASFATLVLLLSLTYPSPKLIRLAQAQTLIPNGTSKTASTGVRPPDLYFITEDEDSNFTNGSRLSL